MAKAQNDGKKLDNDFKFKSIVRFFRKNKQLKENTPFQA